MIEFGRTLAETSEGFRVCDAWRGRLGRECGAPFTGSGDTCGACEVRIKRAMHSEPVNLPAVNLTRTLRVRVWAALNP